MNDFECDSHNSIPLYAAEAVGTTSATLVFGVGLRDESPLDAGITHLLEHLILRRAQPVTILHDGKTGADSVEFFASGDPASVAAFMNAIGVAIAEIASVSDEEIALEKLIIEAEHPFGFRTVSPGLLTYRFGVNGLGVALGGAPTTAAITRDELIGWAQAWLTSSNAAISYIGTVQSNLDVRLPGGTAPMRAVVVPTTTTPVLIRSAKEGIALSFLVSSGPVDLLGEALAYELLATLRHESALIYWVNIIVTPVDGRLSQLDLVLDPLPRNTAAALRASIKLIRDLTERGFTPAAVDAARNIRAAGLGWADAALSAHLDRCAIDRLRGRVTPSRKKIDKEIASVSSIELRDILSTALGTLIVACDRDLKLRKSTVRSVAMRIDDNDIWGPAIGVAGECGDAVPADNMWQARKFRETLLVEESQLILRRADDEVALHFSDIVLIGDRRCGCLFFLDRLGRTLEIECTEWKRGKSLRRRLLKVLPAHLVREFPT